jgi:glycosyltransferase involved in cell wall biosynthesis
MSTDELPLVSVVIPVYNGGEDLRLCLEALEATVYPSWECIVVDDGSSDGSSALAQSYGATVVVSKRPQTGPARSRNLGAAVAEGSIILFIDADVLVRPDTVGHVVDVLQANPDLAACIGSYDDTPAASNFLSQFKNLQHHYVHQTSRLEASTFWTGCGAIRRSVFLDMGGFSVSFARPSIEDIELGYRLHEAGHRIRLDKQLQVKHLKRWTARSLLLTDLRDRAIPWTLLILRGDAILDDLNVRTTQRLSVIAVYASLLSLLVGLFWPWAFLVTAFAIIAVLFLNRDFYRFMARRRGILFLLQALPWHWTYFLYSGLGFGLGVLAFLMSKLRPSPHGAETEKPTG